MHAAENPLKVDQFQLMVTSFDLLNFIISNESHDTLICVQFY